MQVTTIYTIEHHNTSRRNFCLYRIMHLYYTTPFVSRLHAIYCATTAVWTSPVFPSKVMGYAPCKFSIAKDQPSFCTALPQELPH